VAESASSLALPSDHIVIDHPKITITEDPVAVEVTNSFETSDLLVKVSFTGVGREDFAKPVTLDVDCTLAGAADSVLHQQVEVTPTPGQDTTAAGPFGPLPVGAVCAVSTLSAHGADAIPQKVEVTGEQGTTAVAEVAATYSAGAITVVKKLAGSGAHQHGSDTFAMEVTCQQSDGGQTVLSGTVTITGAGSATLSDSNGKPLLAPAHSHCWASETSTGGATSVSIDHDSFATAVHVDPDLPDSVQQLTITVTNTFVAATDNLAYTGVAMGWGLPIAGLLSVGLGIWLVRRRRDEVG
jgi:LPXTG-motif cell wall-anchored protein